jgi:two-component system, LytTR family, response regulator
MEDSHWMEAARNSVRIHLRTESIVLKSSLDRILNEIDGGTFVRIHRGTIVNIFHIRELCHWLRGTYRVILTDRTDLLMSRTYRNQLFQLLGKPVG